MDRGEAARVLGVDADADRATVRGAFRTLIRAHHPDRAGAAAAGTSSRLIDAQRILLSPPPTEAVTPAPGPATARVPSPPVDARVDGDSLLVRAEPEVVVARLIEAAHRLGEITYLDRAAGLVEVLVQVRHEDDAHPTACSLVASLQGRADAVEVFCTVERLDGHPAPPIAPLVRALGDALTDR